MWYATQASNRRAVPRVGGSATHTCEPRLGQFIAPEAATTLWSNGMSVSDLKTDEDGVAFQIKLMDLQMFLEDTFCELAERTGQRSVVLCDRGTMDGKAYSSSQGWTEVLAPTLTRTRTLSLRLSLRLTPALTLTLTLTLTRCSPRRRSTSSSCEIVGTTRSSTLPPPLMAPRVSTRVDPTRPVWRARR